MAERIHLPAQIEIRTDDDGNDTIVGLGAVFHNSSDPGTEFELFDNVIERVARGAFDRALEERQDVRALVNHDQSQILGRTTAGTLNLRSTERGLEYEVTLPKTSFANDLAISIRRGDITQSSFGFRPTKVEWSEEGSNHVRTIKDADLFDVSPVTFPAYKSSTVSLRNEARQEYDAWRHSLQVEIDIARKHRERTLQLLELPT